MGFYEKPSKFTNLAETSNFLCRLPCLRIFKFSAKRLQKVWDFVKNYENSSIWPKLGFCEKPLKPPSKHPRVLATDTPTLDGGRRGPEEMFQVSHDHRSYERNLSNCVQKPEKVRTSTRFERFKSAVQYMKHFIYHFTRNISITIIITESEK